MANWEYSIYRARSSAEHDLGRISERIGALGADAWELVSVVERVTGPTLLDHEQVFYFKRPIDGTPRPVQVLN